ncbi:solute carrier family 25 member 35 [Rhipicephalus sanguineus]|nr:solute carrier family 25 member 35 [Rhipicephalus sanguineus]
MVGPTVATLIMHPFDITRTRMQVQGELLRRGFYVVMYQRTFQSLRMMAHTDGPWSVYRGLMPSIAYRQVTHGLRLGVFQVIEDYGMTLDENLEPSVRLSAISGALCGALGAFLGSPLQLVKCQLQTRASPQIAVGYQHHYRSSIEAFRTIYRAHGLRRGLWRAAQANVLRLSIASAIQMGAYVQAKRKLSHFDANGPHHVITSTAAAVYSSIAAAPAVSTLDMIKTRMYLQPVDRRGRGIYYASVLDCIRKIYMLEGLAGYSRGLLIAFLYSILNSSITLLSWDELKRLRSESREHHELVVEIIHQKGD